MNTFADKNDRVIFARLGSFYAVKALQGLLLQGKPGPRRFFSSIARGFGNCRILYGYLRESRAET